MTAEELAEVLKVLNANNEGKTVVTQTMNFNAPIGQQIAHVDKIEAHFDKDMGMQVLSVDAPAVVEGSDASAELLPLFWGDDKVVEEFLRNISGAKPVQVVAVVNRMLKERKLSEKSCHKPLWEILYKHGLYTRNLSNWNAQIEG